MRSTSLTLLPVALLLVANLVMVSAACGADLEKGRVFYRPCATCHDLAAEGDLNLNSPSLSGLPSWYIVKQINNFKAGTRGAHMADQHGSTMRPMTESITSDQQLEDVVAYIASLPVQKPPRTLEGDPAKGKLGYEAICRTCHGGDANGNESLGAPRLKFTQDWYLLRSIRNFQNGVRGNMGEDFSGPMMAEIARSLKDEEQILDIIAYIMEM